MKLWLNSRSYGKGIGYISINYTNYFRTYSFHKIAFKISLDLDKSGKDALPFLLLQDKKYYYYSYEVFFAVSFLYWYFSLGLKLPYKRILKSIEEV
jgi:hypothetical protein